MHKMRIQSHWIDTWWICIELMWPQLLKTFRSIRISKNPTGGFGTRVLVTIHRTTLAFDSEGVTQPIITIRNTHFGHYIVAALEFPFAVISNLKIHRLGVFRSAFPFLGLIQLNFWLFCYFLVISFLQLYLLFYPHYLEIGQIPKRSHTCTL